jgi:hypothetical protein
MIGVLDLEEDRDQVLLEALVLFHDGLDLAFFDVQNYPSCRRIGLKVERAGAETGLAAGPETKRDWTVSKEGSIGCPAGGQPPAVDAFNLKIE